MAIYYCDLSGGTDANNGLTPSTPKISLSACTNLVTAYGDEIRVRGTDNYATNLGSMWWRNGSTSITGTTDLTGVLTTNDYIYKAGDAVTLAYKVNGLTFSAGVMTITLRLNLGTFDYPTEYADVMKVNTSIPSTSFQLTSNKDGFYSGTTTLPFARTGITISGGWDETYTNRTGFTSLYNSATSLTRFVMHKYWDLKNFIIRGGGLVSSEHEFGSYDNFVMIETTGFNGLGQYTLFKNSSSGGVTSPRFHTRIQSTIYNCKFINGSQNIYYYAASNFLNNHVSNYAGQLTANGTLSPGSTFNFNTISFGGYQIFGAIVSCLYSGNTIYSTATNAWYNGNRQIIVDNTIIGGGGGCSAESNLVVIRTPINIQNNASKMWYFDDTTETYTLPNGLLFGVLSAGVDYDTTIVKLRNKSVIMYNTACVETTGVTHGGTSGLKISQYSASYAGVVGTIEFVVNAGTTYNLSFWVKSSNNQNIEYNYLYFGLYKLSTWASGTTTTSGWTNITATLPSFPNNGTCKLYFRINSGAGHWVYVSDISIT